MTAYAAPAARGKFRIAIVVSGLGISAKATSAALASLPPGVTLGFAPYAGDVQHWVNQARQFGHEVLLEVPMEPFDFPDSDPGPHTLRAGVGRGRQYPAPQLGAVALHRLCRRHQSSGPAFSVRYRCLVAGPDRTGPSGALFL